MNKLDLVAKIAEDAELSKKSAEAALNAFIKAVEGALKKGEKVQLVGFGSFEVRKRAARKGRNPQTKEEIIYSLDKLGWLLCKQYIIKRVTKSNSFFIQ